MTMTTHAIILAAGFGSRLEADEGHKLLVTIRGRTLLERHLENFTKLGVTHVTIVTGFRHEVLEATVRELTAAHPMRMGFAYNADFERSNGLSVLAGVRASDGRVPFWLTMADHLFEPALFDDIAQRLERAEFLDGMEGALFVDAKLETIFDVPDATKVRFGQDGRLEAISKELDPFDVADVGLFYAGQGFVDALIRALDERGDCSTSDAVKILCAQARFAFPDVGEALWQDVDTPGARMHAEKLAASWKE